MVVLQLFPSLYQQPAMPAYALPPPDPAPKSYPFLEKVSSALPNVTPVRASLVPKEWAAFKKAVIDYNLSLELYKSDLDWKKENLQELTEPTALAKYHLRIGHANQRVGAVALMERTIGQYIQTVGADLVTQQAGIDDLKLPQDDITWFLTQGAKDTS